jgi:hypothetical protein
LGRRLGYNAITSAAFGLSSPFGLADAGSRSASDKTSTLSYDAQVERPGRVEARRMHYVRPRVTARANTTHVLNRPCPERRRPSLPGILSHSRCRSDGDHRYTSTDKLVLPRSSPTPILAPWIS